MNTYHTFSAYGSGVDTALEEARDRVLELEAKWSATEENSEIFQLNHGNGEVISLSCDTADILNFTLEIAEKTDGALDPTLYPVLTAWGFTTKENQIPKAAELQTLLENTGWEKVSSEGNQVQIPEGMELDLGAVGKGYAGDEAAEILKEKGITSDLLNLGGNVQAIGSRPGGGSWRLGIRDPSGEGNIGILEVSDQAVVTSGNYERYFVGEDGNTYAHILDPSTGYPVKNGLMSVTVITKEGKKADALSTSLFVMGLEKAENFWRAHPDFDMILITEEDEIYLTEGIRKTFACEDPAMSKNIHIIEKGT